MASAQIRFPPAFDRAANRFRQSLTLEEKKKFSHLTSIKDVWDLTEELQKEQGSRNSLQNMHRIQPFIDGMTQYAQVIEVFVQVKPDIMALIWGPLKLLLQLASKFTESFEKVLDAIERIGDNLPRFWRFAEIFSYSDRMQEVISTIYEDIMEFYRRTLKFFRRRAWRIVFSLTWTTFESRFGLILSNLRRHQDLVDNEARAEDIVQSHKAREEELKRVEERQKDEINQKMKEMIDWLKPVNIEGEKEKAERLKKPGTGNWLLETAGVKDWINGKGKPLVWLTGKPGSGKTILAYTILEHLEQRKASAILCTLIYQIILQMEDLLAYAYEERMKPLSVSLLKRLFHHLLDASVSPSEHVYIIIDGLDELPDTEQRIILPILKALGKSQKQLDTTSRILLASRDVEGIRTGFGGPKTIKVPIEGKNTDDILQYIGSESQRVIEELGLELEMEKIISDSLSARADGMFLWVHLIIESLLLKSTLREIREALDDLPEGLSQIYERILLGIKSLNVTQQTRAKKVLEWMACASCTLKVGELEDALSINLGGLTIDKEDRILRDRLRYLCGPIVEFANGTIIFVHFTAKEYLLSTNSGPFIDRLTAHLNISLICTTYQCFNCFEPTISTDEAIRFVLNGDLRLFDYVQSNWLEHIKEFCKFSPGQSEVRLLSAALKRLFQRRQRHSSRVFLPNLPRSSGSNSHSSLLGSSTKPNNFDYFEPELKAQLIEVQEYHEILAEKVSSLGCDEVAHWCDENNPLIVDQGGRKLQGALEAFINEQPPDTERIEELKALYGENLYMCTYEFCQMSSSGGFATQADRKIHEDKHVKPYRCQVQGCIYGSRDFTSRGLLQKHMKDYHNAMISKVPAIAVEILNDRKKFGQDSLLDQKISSAGAQAHLENINFSIDLMTDKIDEVLNSAESQIPPLSYSEQASNDMQIVQKIINICTIIYKNSTKGSYIENIESSHIEIILSQLSSQLKSWKDLVKAFYFVSQDLAATEQLILNILYCREQYSDDFKTPNGRYTMTPLMLQQVRELLTKCFAYIQNATYYRQDQANVQQHANPSQYIVAQLTFSSSTPEGPPDLADERMEDAPKNDRNVNLLDRDPVSKPSDLQSPRNVKLALQLILGDIKGQGQGQGWQCELTPSERASVITQLITSLRTLRSDVELQHAIEIAKTFERNTYDKAGDKGDYRVKTREKILQIQGSRWRQMAAEEVKARDRANILPLTPSNESYSQLHPQEPQTISLEQQPHKANQQVQGLVEIPKKQQKPLQPSFAPLKDPGVSRPIHTPNFGLEDLQLAARRKRSRNKTQPSNPEPPRVLDSDSIDIFEPGTLRSTGYSNQPSLFSGFRPNDNDGVSDYMDISEPENLPEESHGGDTLSAAQQRFWFEGGPPPDE